MQFPTPDDIRVPAGGAWLQADLVLPAGARGLVLFAHGSGSGRHSARNRLVARRLHDAGFATLLPDLLTVQEQQDDSRHRHLRFDMPLLTGRLQDVTAWAAQQPRLAGLPLAYVGGSTGSAAALIAAARLGRRVSAVVSRGGRPDLAGPAVLAAVVAPTLLVVGAADGAALALNEAAAGHLRCKHRLAMVPGAGHLFEEPGALDAVADEAVQWLALHLAGVGELVA